MRGSWTLWTFFVSILLPGFLYLNKLFIEKNQPETIWMMLRTFGYNDDYSLSGFHCMRAALAERGKPELVKDGAQQRPTEAAAEG